MFSKIHLPHWSIAPGILEMNLPKWLAPASLSPDLARGHDPRSESFGEYVARLANEKFGVRQTQPGVAQMTISGTMVPGIDPIEELCYGCYNTERIFTNLSLASGMPGLKLLAITFDTPGGSVIALKEASAALEAFSAETGIVTVGWMPFCASAGIHVAVGCDVLAAPPFGQVGSIGTYIAIPDLTGYFEKMGVSWTILRDGKYKAMGHPGKKLTQDELDLLAERLDKIGTEFKSRVATRRPGMTAEHMQGQMFTAEDRPELVDTTDYLRLEDLIADALT